MHVHLLATLRPPDHAILLAQNDSVTETLGERRRSVHSSSAFHIVDGGLLGDLDLERGPSCGVAHVMAAGLAPARATACLLASCCASAPHHVQASANDLAATVLMIATWSWLPPHHLSRSRRRWGSRAGVPCFASA